MVDTVIVPSTGENQEDPKHTAAMVAAVDNAAAAPEGEGGEPTPAERPEWLPEKFKSPEDLAKAYAELEGKLGGGKPAAEAGAKPEADPKTTEGAPNDPATVEAQKALGDAGLSFDAFSEEFAEKGALSPESYEKLAKAGINKDIVDRYIAGQQAISEQLQAEVKAVIGGDEEFAAMSEWAKVNVPVADLEAYNRAVSSGDVAQAKLAIAGLNQRYREANPVEPNLVQGENGRVAADAYESIAQLQADMSKPEYKQDPAFRRKVREKLGRSDIL